MGGGRLFNGSQRGSSARDTVCSYATKTETWLAGPDGVVHVEHQRVAGLLTEAHTRTVADPSLARAPITRFARPLIDQQ